MNFGDGSNIEANFPIVVLSFHDRLTESPSLIAAAGGRNRTVGESCPFAGVFVIALLTLRFF